MSTFLAVRYVAFALFILFCGLTGSFAALNLGFITSGVVKLQPPVEALGIYLIIISVANVVFLVPVIGTELYRKGALTSRIWFELLWVSIFFLAYLGGAISATLLTPSAVCQTAGPMKLACMSSMALIAFAWISSSIYLIYFFTLLAYCIIHSKPNFNIWNTSVVDDPWAPKPLTIAQRQTQSIDSRRTLTDVHAFTLKADYSRDDVSDLEKDNSLPIYGHNTRSAGVPTFGASHAPGRRGGGIDLGTQSSRVTHGQNMGVNAINGAPAYHVQQHFNDQGAHRFYSNPRGDVENQNDMIVHGGVEPLQGSRQAPWAADEETPSPAIITHASRVPQPSMSLYPAHIVNAGLTTQSAKPQGAINDLLRAAGLNQSATSLPYLNSSNGHTREADRISVLSGESGHTKSQSVDSMIQSYSGYTGSTAGAGARRSTSDERVQKRGRSSRPRHRPPPLDLSALSNIKNADRR
jgi:hypothetical protein